MTEIKYEVYGCHEEYFLECKKCSAKIKEIKNRCILDILEKLECLNISECEKRSFPYAIKFIMDGAVFGNQITLRTSDDKKICGEAEIKQLRNKNEELECSINIQYSSKIIEKSTLQIDGWYKSRGIKFECSQVLEYDQTKNKKTKTYGFPIMSTYLAQFINPYGETKNVTIDVVSEVIDVLHIMNVNNEYQDIFPKNVISINSVCTGWHKIFGQYRYISPLTFKTIPEDADIESTDRISTALQAVGMSDYNTLMFCFSLYSLGRSLLTGNAKEPIALNIISNACSHDEAINIARNILDPVTMLYNEKYSEDFCNNYAFSPKKYLIKLVPELRREPIRLKIHYGRFRDITVVSSGKHVSNRYDKTSEYESCTISNNMLQNKLKSERSYVFFNLQNTSQNIISYEPRERDLEIIRTEQNSNILKESSNLLINCMILFMEKDMNKWRLKIDKKNLKSLHKDIVEEANTQFFKRFTKLIIYESLKKLKNSNYRAEFLQKLNLNDLIEVYNSEFIKNSYRNMSQDEIERESNKIENMLIDYVMENSLHRGKTLRLFGRVIDDVGYRLIYDEDEIEKYTSFEELTRKKQHKVVKEIVQDRNALNEQLDELTDIWFDEYLAGLMKKMFVYTEISKPKKLRDFQKKALNVLKNSAGLSNEMSKILKNFYAMSLYFSEFISDRYPECRELCDKMLERLLKILERTESGSNKRLLDVNSTALVFSDFILESGSLSLEKAGGEKNNAPLYYTDGNGGLINGTAGVYKARENQLCYYSSGDSMNIAFENYLNVKGYATDISIKRCISDVLVPEKTICTYRSRYSSEVTVDKIRQKAYKFYMDKLSDFNKKRNKNR